MPITFNCPGCGKGYTVPDGVGGKSTKCRACGAAITIPMAGAASPMPAAVGAPAPARSGGGFPVKKIALVAVAFLVVVTLGYGGYALVFSGGSAAMKYMPDNTKVLVSMRPADFMKSGVWADIKKDNPDINTMITEKMKEAPFQLEDLNQILFGISDFSKKEMVLAFEFKKPVKFEDIVTFMEKQGGGPNKLTESKIGSYTVKGDDTSTFCQISSTLIVGGPPATMKAILERDKKPTFSEGLQKALKDADLSQTVCVAVDIKGVGSDPNVSGAAKSVKIDVNSVEAAVVNIAVTNDVKVNALAVCKDAKTAESYRKIAEGGVEALKNMAGDQVPKDVMAMLDTLKIKEKDNQLTAEMLIKVAPLIPLAKQVLGQEAKKSFSTTGQQIGGPVGKP